jgi:prepilin-type N-terminal cleavage/methylation domain-containing protein
LVIRITQMKKQTGFTLIELAIVLVIIGLLLGGVLRGQELINSARVKSMIRDFQNTQVFLYGYQDRFRALPGDDAGVVGRNFGGTLATTDGPVGNGQIGGAWNANTATSEATLFWEHVRLAGFAPGPTAAGVAGFLPTNANGGAIGIQSIGAGFATITGMAGSFAICSDGIIGRDAIDMDTQIDDGNTATGNMRTVVQGAPGPGVANAAIVPAANHTVCMSI